MNHEEAQELHRLIGEVLQDLTNGKTSDITIECAYRARELASILVSDTQDCEFEQQNPHEWYCKTHEVLKVAGTQEPVTCN